MKTSFFMSSFVLLIMIGAIDAYPQHSFLAGQHNANNYYKNFDPDTTLVGPNNHGPGLPPAIFDIDINGDGVKDFYIYALGEWANGFGGGEISVNAYNPDDQIAFGYNDTCHMPNSTYIIHKMAKSFRLNDTINSNSGWGMKLFLSYSDWYLMTYSCNNNSFTNNPLGNYIGVRILEPNDTVYGWIKMTNTSGLSFTVQEFGCSKNSTGINELMDLVRIYPIPVNGKVRIEATLPEFDLTVYNQYGVEIYTRKQIKSKTQIDMDGTAKGVYIFKIVRDQTVIVKKVIKQ